MQQILDRYGAVRTVLRKKKSLTYFYREVYQEYIDVLKRCPPDGVCLEIGSGAGFAKEMIPDIVTSDIEPYNEIDQIIDGTQLPYQDKSLKMICMLNVFHHMADVAAFLNESQRCLAVGGRILIADQHIGVFSRYILKKLHDEPFNPDATEWPLEPYSDANGALAWIVFVRDVERLESLFPNLRLVRYQTHSPLRYWLAGGLKNWNLLPGCFYGIAKAFDEFLLGISRDFGSFVYIEMVKTD